MPCGASAFAITMHATPGPRSRESGHAPEGFRPTNAPMARFSEPDDGLPTSATRTMHEHDLRSCRSSLAGASPSLFLGMHVRLQSTETTAASRSASKTSEPRESSPSSQRASHDPSQSGKRPISGPLTRGANHVWSSDLSRAVFRRKRVARASSARARNALPFGRTGRRSCRARCPSSGPLVRPVSRGMEVRKDGTLRASQPGQGPRYRTAPRREARSGEPGRIPPLRIRALAWIAPRGYARAGLSLRRARAPSEEERIARERACAFGSAPNAPGPDEHQAPRRGSVDV